MKLSKKENLKNFNQTLILTAAKELFLNNGIEATTMDEIAKTSEFSKSTLYVYFKSKDDILHHILYEYMELLLTRLKSETDIKNSFKVNFEKTCDVMTKYQSDYPMYFDLIIAEISIDKNSEYPILHDIYEIGEQINNYLATIISCGIERKEIAQDLAVIPTIFTLWAELYGILSLSHNKEAYIKHRMNLTRNEFLNHSFNLLFRSITN